MYQPFKSPCFDPVWGQFLIILNAVLKLNNLPLKQDIQLWNRSTGWEGIAIWKICFHKILYSTVLSMAAPSRSEDKGLECMTNPNFFHLSRIFFLGSILLSLLLKDGAIQKYAKLKKARILYVKIWSCGHSFGHNFQPNRGPNFLKPDLERACSPFILSCC